MQAELLPVAPPARNVFSTTTTSRTPRSARWKAMLAPVTPPPMMTTSAVSATIFPPLTVARSGPATAQRCVVDDEADRHGERDAGLDQCGRAGRAEAVAQLQRGVEQKERDRGRDENPVRRDEAHAQTPSTAFTASRHVDTMRSICSPVVTSGG